MHKKTKGSVAELAVASRLMRDGWHVLVPYGENTRYDLVAERAGKFIRIQVKYVTPKNGTLCVNCRSSNNWSVLPYTAEEIDVIAVYDASSESIYYVPAADMRGSAMKLRLEPARNHQKAKIRFASQFIELSEIALGRCRSGQSEQSVKLPGLRPTEVRTLPCPPLH